MKTKIFLKIIVAFIVSFFPISLYATDTTNHQAEIKIRCIRDNYSVKLRWSTTNSEHWEITNKKGFRLERYTFKRNGTYLDSPEKTIIADSIKALPLPQWKDSVLSNNYAAIIAQALYGDTFSITSSNSPSNEQHLVVESQEMQQRFLISMYAADLDFSIAKMAGWGYTDKTAKFNEEYLYRIYCADSTLDNEIQYGICVTDEKHELPEPTKFEGNFEDGIVFLTWNVKNLRTSYVAYQVERSEDSINFKPRFSPLIMNMAGKENIVIPDSLPLNNKKYYYRMYGVTIFGEKGPYSNIISGEGFRYLTANPSFNEYYSDDKGDIHLNWDFNESEEELIKCFELRHAISPSLGYVPIIKDINPKSRNITLKSNEPSNYFVLAAIPHKGKELVSLPVFVQLVDSIPPSAPKGLKGDIDKNGIVTLTWDKNTESDIYGYRIFKRPSNEGKMFKMNDVAISQNQFQDTISLTDLNRYVYYSVAAIDARYNQSELSDTLRLSKPDIIPPTSPALKSYKATNQGIKLEWISSTVEDAKLTIIYRSTKQELESFEKVKEISIDSTEWVDTNTQYGLNYFYILKTQDEALNLSEPTPLLCVRAKTQKQDTITLNLNHLPQGRLLTWKLPKEINNGVIEIYRSCSDDTFRLWKSFTTAETSIADTELVKDKPFVYFIKYRPTKGYPIYSTKVK